ncbi:hypothetical protein E3T55_10760 [Cryobacterium frigoriphilum]|uniref:Uncharacterized protein n=1 Tax=Cryobacterium frigoriphilum TaxID=1259150 RepID=A0A4R9A0L2_9MICO|nr:hypothetical protein [Cryobacterium frigoriphilum]TFD49827.1 hypothetical protein E3T55_10760 [Cryobacterium frigoriphilum]
MKMKPFNAHPEIDPDVENAIAAARRLRALREVSGRDYMRSVCAAFEAGAYQREIAEALGVSQVSICVLIKKARKRGIHPLPAGSAGATAYEIAERFAAGLISREVLLRELSAWPYVSSATPDATPDAALDRAPVEWDSSRHVIVGAGVEAISLAFDHGLIDAAARDAILAAAAEARGASLDTA